MFRIVLAAAAAFLFSHAAMAQESAVGGPGKADAATRTVEVTTDDREGMVYRMDLDSVRAGETIRFVVTNAGDLDHQFAIGDKESHAKHLAAIEEDPDALPEGPGVVSVAPGETKELIWTFAKPADGEVVFACYFPGHVDGGMIHEVKIDG